MRHLGRQAEARTRYYFREEAKRIGWNPGHPGRGGSLLEEQEVISYYPELKAHLGLERPDFLMIFRDSPAIVVECRNEFKKLDSAIADGKGYCDKINKVYAVNCVLGVAGTPDTAVQIRVEYRTEQGWQPLIANGQPLTQIPSPYELDTALHNNNGTTDVELPNEGVFLEAAINISSALRTAKIEEPDRPKILGALILAMHCGSFSIEPQLVLQNINTNVAAEIMRWDDLTVGRRDQLTRTLQLSLSSPKLPLYIPKIMRHLERLNIKALLESPVDFLGKFYEAFFRYGSDSAKQGIVFTPRHVTKYCADIADISLGMKVYDPACGTGGFLVAAFDRMRKDATTNAALRTLKESLFGYDTAATVWALAVLNMRFRGDGKSHIELDSSLDHAGDHRLQFDRALLNPPFSQEEEPEYMFVDHALASTRPGGEVAAVIPSGMLADDEHKLWRERLQTMHQPLAVISMPSELFYPRGAPTAILLVKAHAPNPSQPCLFARVKNDGYTISKNKRIEVDGSELPLLADLIKQVKQGIGGHDLPSAYCTKFISDIPLRDELCAEKWLPQRRITEEEFLSNVRALKRGIFIAIVNHPEMIDHVIEDFTDQLAQLPERTQVLKPIEPLGRLFDIRSGRAKGGVNSYPVGNMAYVSSGDDSNSIIGTVTPANSEIETQPCITVTAFGQASIQPWVFAGRGNGGSCVRILTPRHKMTMEELTWYAVQINWQKWRFHFGRMAIVTRLKNLEVETPSDMLRSTQPIDLVGVVREAYRSIQNTL